MYCLFVCMSLKLISVCIVYIFVHEITYLAALIYMTILPFLICRTVLSQQTCSFFICYCLILTLASTLATKMYSMENNWCSKDLSSYSWYSVKFILQHSPL